MMRDPARIERMLDHINYIWQKEPDLRLGQLLVNVLPEFGEGPYYIEDHLLENAILLWRQGDNAMTKHLKQPLTKALKPGYKRE